MKQKDSISLDVTFSSEEFFDKDTKSSTLNKNENQASLQSSSQYSLLNDLGNIFSDPPNELKCLSGNKKDSVCIKNRTLKAFAWKAKQ